MGRRRISALLVAVWLLLLSLVRLTAPTPGLAAAAGDVVRPAPRLTVGRDVHYVLQDGPHAGEHRPAKVVRVWSDTCANLLVFLDGENDYRPPQADAPFVLWRTSVPLSADHATGSWHWPELFS